LLPGVEQSDRKFARLLQSSRGGEIMRRLLTGMTYEDTVEHGQLMRY